MTHLSRPSHSTKSSILLKQRGTEKQIKLSVQIHKSLWLHMSVSHSSHFPFPDKPGSEQLPHLFISVPKYLELKFRNNVNHPRIALSNTFRPFRMLFFHACHPCISRLKRGKIC